MSDLHARFDEITADMAGEFEALDAELTPETADRTPLELALYQAQDELTAEWGDGFAPEAAGRRAWDKLDVAERDAALDELLYVYAGAVEHDTDEHQRHERERQPRAELTAKLAAYRTCRRYGDQPDTELLLAIARLADTLHGGERS